MKTKKILGLALAMALMVVGAISGLAHPLPQVQVASYSVAIQETENGLVQLVFFLDLNGNEQLDKGEPIVQVITIAP